MAFPAQEPRELMVEMKFDTEDGRQLPADFGGRGGRLKQVFPIGGVVFGPAAPDAFEAVVLTDAGDGLCLLGSAGSWSWGGWSWHASSGMGFVDFGFTWFYRCLGIWPMLGCAGGTDGAKPTDAWRRCLR